MNHLETFQFERYVPLKEQNWLHWASRVESLLGHSLDGNEDQDGYSLDYAYDWFKLGVMPDNYVKSVKAAKRRISFEKQ